MTDEKIKEEFDSFMDKPIPNTMIFLARKLSDGPKYGTIEYSRKLAYSQGLGYVCGFRAAERLAKIEVLEELIKQCKDMDQADYVVCAMEDKIEQLKESNK